MSLKNWQAQTVMVIIQQIFEIKIKEDYVVIKIYYDLYEQVSKVIWVVQFSLPVSLSKLSF